MTNGVSFAVGGRLKEWKSAALERCCWKARDEHKGGEAYAEK